MDELLSGLETFQAQMVALTRAFGWHRPDSTPCGQPVPISEAHALLELGRVPHLSQQELATALNLRKSTVSRVVSNLERRGWVERVRSRDDRRAFEVSLTPAGKNSARVLAAARERKMAEILARVPQHERADVVRALHTLTEAIHESET